ncbi:hypothetical protein RLOC_00004435 [Lonchura striata]|uniref:Uncharacterized protein n=1 Tax=Lonchura striata TaxID=40157 RepID=A0A218UKA7_9PASE|nr:hypothetical protein RLOC_00004435 [Lonchura striata domestica]
MGASQSIDIPGGGTEGYHVLRVRAAPPGGRPGHWARRRPGGAGPVPPWGRAGAARGGPGAAGPPGLRRGSGERRGAPGRAAALGPGESGGGIGAG